MGLYMHACHGLIEHRPMQVYISTGSLISSQLDQQEIDAITSTMRPSLREHEYGRAMQAAVVDVGLFLSTAYFPDYDADYHDDYDGDYGSAYEGGGFSRHHRDSTGAPGWAFWSACIGFVAACFLIENTCYSGPRRQMAPTRRHVITAPPEDAVAVTRKLEQIKTDLQVRRRCASMHEGTAHDCRLVVFLSRGPTRLMFEWHAKASLASAPTCALQSAAPAPPAPRRQCILVQSL